MIAEEIHHIRKQGALSIPETALRNELIRCYVEYVYPYMPSIELHNFLRIVYQKNGEGGKISLLLFQAVMFAATAFVDMGFLEEAGFNTRIAARNAFYQKTRVGVGLVDIVIYSLTVKKSYYTILITRLILLF